MALIGIIGAGITGLTAANALRLAGLSVAVYEASNRSGGVIRSHREGPWLAEGGPNTILETSPLLVSWIDQLGIGPRRLHSNPKATARFVVRDGRPVLLPGSVPGFFLSRLYSGRAKMRLLAEPFISRGQGDESVADFVRRRLGQEFLDYAIDPMVTGIYAGDPGALSVQQAFPRIHALEERYGSLIRGQLFGGRERRRRGEVSKAHAKKFSFDDGLQVLPEALHRRLGEAVHLRTTVREVTRVPTGWRITATRDDTPVIADHQAVVFCGTAHSLGRIAFHAPGFPSLDLLSRVDSPPVTSVVLGFRRSDVAHPCEGFGMLIPHREGFGILGTIFSSSLFPGRAPDDHLTLTTYVGGARNREVAHLEEGPLLEVVLRDLGRLLGVRGSPVFRHITRWQRAIPQYNVGHGKVRQALDELEAGFPGLFAAGNFRDGIALSDSILAGMRVAERITLHLRTASTSKPVHSA